MLVFMNGKEFRTQPMCVRRARGNPQIRDIRFRSTRQHMYSACNASFICRSENPLVNAFSCTVATTHARAFYTEP